jgi:hypothetical protein
MKNNNSLNFASVVAQIAGEETEIGLHPAAMQTGGSAFLYNWMDGSFACVAVWHPSVAARTNGASLAAAAHESVHVLRYREGLAYYRKDVSTITIQEMAAEEAIVNEIARETLRQMIGEAHREWKKADKYFAYSTESYRKGAEKNRTSGAHQASAQMEKMQRNIEIGVKIGETIRRGPVAIARAAGKVGLAAGKSVGKAGLGLGKQGLERAVVSAPTPQQVCQKAVGLGHGLKSKITRVKPGSRVEITATADEIAI